MYKSRLETLLPDLCPGDLWNWHSRTGAFERLSPPWNPVRTVGSEPALEQGSVWSIRVALGPFAASLRFRIAETDAPHGFRIVQESGPFGSWSHTHRFEQAPGGSRLIDEIEWTQPYGVPGRILSGMIHIEIARMLAFRHRRTVHDLRVTRDLAASMGVVGLTGAGGFVGGALRTLLSAGGVEVRRFVRESTTDANRQPQTDVRWDPVLGFLDPRSLCGLDAVIHLAGENVAARRWTREIKERIRQSRIQGTRLLARTLAQLPWSERPSAAIGASAIGWYGPGADVVDESSGSGEGFLPEVVRAWEDAWEPARQAGVRVVTLRIGVVVGVGGGVLGRTLGLFRAGLGGPVGSPSTPLSWIARDDLLAIIVRCLLDRSLEGPINAVSPEPSTQGGWARAVGLALGRPAILPVPAMAVKALLGEMGRAMVLEGRPVDPARLRDSGFVWSFPTLRAAIAHEAGGRISTIGTR